MNNRQPSASASSGEHTGAPAPQVNAAVNESQRKAFVFYSNWYTDSMQSLDEEEQARFILVLVRYACHGILPDATVPPVLRTMFGLVRPAIDADLKKYDKITETNRRRAEKRKKQGVKRDEARCVENQRTTSPNPIINNQQSAINNQQSTSETEEKEEAAQVRFSEVEAYWREHCLRSDAHEFYNYYEAHGWISRKGTHIQSWKKAALMWEDKFRRDVLPMQRREAAAEAQLKRHEQAVYNATVRREERQRREAAADDRARRAVTPEQGQHMYRRALQLAAGDDTRAIDLLKRANDDATLYARLCEGWGTTAPLQLPPSGGELVRADRSV